MQHHAPYSQGKVSKPRTPPIKDGNETIDEDEEELGGGPFTMAIVEEITLHMNFEQHVIFAKSGYYHTRVSITPTRVGTLQAIQMFVM
jgi:hypothetical protein